MCSFCINYSTGYVNLKYVNLLIPLLFNKIVRTHYIPYQMFLYHFLKPPKLYDCQILDKLFVHGILLLGQHFSASLITDLFFDPEKL